MAAHCSGRALPVVALTLVLAATLASCDRGADAPADNNRPAVRQRPEVGACLILRLSGASVYGCRPQPSANVLN